ncbi:hypothetical protein [Streptomyces sp. NBC_00203]|uniref:hypothetical protein n=1 Tax=Streptomyces sp. NBC_00203 TaxID=2975680 RepID=UPI003865D66F
MPTPPAPRFAEKCNLKTLSDLRNSVLEVKIVAGDECETRPFFAPGLKKMYGIGISGIDPRAWARHGRDAEGMGEAHRRAQHG